ncbi:hypothetical protein BD414DRAFT_321033 [Trametes punicea]|nr:hypothetical protein BD414DRAFT_321033 [Trametes punicea]
MRSAEWMIQPNARALHPAYCIEDTARCTAHQPTDLRPASTHVGTVYSTRQGPPSDASSSPDPEPDLPMLSPRTYSASLIQTGTRTDRAPAPRACEEQDTVVEAYCAMTHRKSPDSISEQLLTPRPTYQSREPLRGDYIVEAAASSSQVKSRTHAAALTGALSAPSSNTPLTPQAR